MSSLTTPSPSGRQLPSTMRRPLLPSRQQLTTSLSAIVLVFLLQQVAFCDYISNNQQQISRKLSSLTSYKDVQLFRFQIPAEVSTAVLRLNATQSEVPLNTSIVLLPASTASTSTSHSNETVLLPPATPPPPTYWPTKPPPTAKPPLINTTLITVYREKAVKFYRSFLSTACKTPVDVTFHLRWGSLPLFAIKNASTPANFIISNETASEQQFRIQLKTDGVGVVFNLSNPLPGDWYGAAYINQVDDHIAQKGLQRECYHRLLAGLSLQRLPPAKAVQQLSTGSCCNSAASAASASTPLRQSLVIDHSDTRPELLYKFYPSAREFGAKIVIRSCHFRPSNNLRHHPSPPGQSSPYASSAAAAEQALISPISGSGFGLNNVNNNAHNTSCPITINFRTLALPSATQKDFTFTCQSNHSSGAVEVTGSRCVIDLPTYAPEQWNYLQISPLLTTEQTSPYEPVRTKLVYGTVNFTLQLLVGQEALLYSHFNEQCTSGAASSLTNALSQQQQQQHHHQQQQLHPSPDSDAPSGPFFGSSSILSSTHNPVLSFPSSFNHVHSGQGLFQTTAASVQVAPAPPEPNAVSSQRKQNEESKPSRSGGVGGSENAAGVALPEVDEFEMNPHSSVISSRSSGSSINGNSFRSAVNATTVFPRTTSSYSNSVSSTSTRSPPSTLAQHNSHHRSSNNHDDTIEYVDDGEDETAVDDEVERALSKSSLSQFNKRSADPQGGSGGGGAGRDRERDRERKKSDKKKEGKKGRGQKGQKGQGKKNKDQQQQQRGMSFEDESCVFDPAKILSSLEEDDLWNMTQPIVSIINITRYQGPEMFEFLYSHLEPAAFFAVVNRNNNNEEEINSSNSSSSVGSINDGTVVSSDNSGYGYGYSTHSAPTTSTANANSASSTDHLFVDVDNDRPSLLNFTLIPQYDLGGSLEISFAISPKTSNEHQNVSAILCLTHHRLPPIVSSSPLLRFDEACTGHLVSNTSVANYSTEGSPIRRLTVPYPQPGTWFISIVVRCYTEEDSLDDPMVANVDYSGYSCDFANRTAVYLEIHSASCQSNSCQNGGKCMQYVSGGILYSTCACRAGWKGLTCADGSEALSEKRLLMNFLLLTVSNAAFIPAIIVAAARRYFTESTVYFITMISSALYHACESDYVQYSYCLLSSSFLQFADFYTAVLSFFVTLITLANLSPRFKSFLHLMGAISIALITQNDRTSLWTFVVPAGLATLLLFTCWCSQCCRRSCYPPGKCWIFSICPALLLTIAGLIIYAFFETQENYAITHSIWHCIVALALLFAIPSMPSKTNTGVEGEEDDERVHFMSSSSSSGAGSGKGSGGGIQNAKSAHVEWRPPHTSFKFLNDDIDML